MKPWTMHRKASVMFLVGPFLDDMISKSNLAKPMTHRQISR